LPVPFSTDENRKFLVPVDVPIEVTSLSLMKTIERKGSLVGDSARRRDGLGDGVELMGSGNAGLAGSRPMKKELGLRDAFEPT
jgi:hypothetical protein